MNPAFATQASSYTRMRAEPTRTSAAGLHGARAQCAILPFMGANQSNRTPAVEKEIPMITRLVSSYGAIAAATFLAAGVLTAFGPAEPSPGDASGVESVIGRVAPAVPDAADVILVGDRSERNQTRGEVRAPWARRT